jgi:hypothetical protein
VTAAQGNHYASNRYDGVFLCPFLRGGASMYITEGQLQEYERIMQEKPVHDRRPIKSVKEQDRRNSQKFETYCRKCSKEKYTLLDDE